MELTILPVEISVKSARRHDDQILTGNVDLTSTSLASASSASDFWTLLELMSIVIDIVCQHIRQEYNPARRLVQFAATQKIELISASIPRLSSHSNAPKETSFLVQRLRTWQTMAHYRRHVHYHLYPGMAGLHSP